MLQTQLGLPKLGLWIQMTVDALLGNARLESPVQWRAVFTPKHLISVLATALQ